MEFIFCVFLITSTLFAPATQSKILVLCASNSYSHYTLAFKLAKELAGREHEVTFVNTYPQEKPIRNLKEISVAELIVDQNERKKQIYDVGKMSYLNVLRFVAEYGWTSTEGVLRAKEVQNLLKSNETFDLVILLHIMNEALMIFPHKFNCPLILLEPLQSSILSNYLFANPSPSPYIPNLLSIFDAHMNFWERLRNFYYEVVGEVFLHYIVLPEQDAILKRTVRGAPRLQSILYNSSLILLSSHISLKGPIPLQPGIKEIGGYHIDPLKPLPTDLQEFLDNPKEGIVFFSMGSVLKSTHFPQDMKDIVLKVFSELKQKILWKFDTDLPEKPKNVKIYKWLPQQDILGHPNVTVFISHGGLLGTTEAIYYGVPLLCMPVFWDQRRNCKDVESAGFGLTVPVVELTEEKFRLALNELLNNTKYRENAKMRSKIMHDQPMKQMDKAVFWIEYVIRHKGASHLRAAGIDLKWYQLYAVDIILFLTLILLTCFIVVFCLCRCLYGKKTIIKNIKKE